MICLKVNRVNVMSKKLLIIALLLYSVTHCFSKGTMLQVDISQWPDTTIILGYYHGGQILVADTIVTDMKGKGTLSTDTLLSSGMYTLYFPDKSNFDILLDNPSKIKIEVKGSDYINDINIEHSKESKAFLEYQRFMAFMQKKRTDIITKYNENKANTDSTDRYKEQLSLMDVEVTQKWEELSKNGNDFLSFFINSLRPIELPDSLKSNDKELQISRYNYMTDNYFEHLPLNDARSLRTPQLAQKIDDYLTKFIIQIPDTIIARGNFLVDKSYGSPQMFQFVAQKVLNFSTKSEMMGLDRLFADIAKKYYLSGKTPWADSTLLSKISKRVAYTQNNHIGQKAKELILQSPSDEFFSLHEVDAPYTVLFFWEPGCSHCKKATPLLNTKVYSKFKEKGLKVFAVYTQDDKDEWNTFIEDKNLFDWIHVYDPYNHSNFRLKYDITTTPQIFILDKNKNILAKKIGVETTAIILERLFETGKIY